MPDTLLIYFSRSGTTERLASQLAAKLGADLELVKPHVSYKGMGGYLRGIWHSLLRRRPAVERGRDPGNYANVIIGSPIWAGRLSAPMRGYLAQVRGRIGPAAAFWVSGSGNAYKTVAAEIEQLTGRALLATASLGQREVGTAAADAKLETMAQALRTRPRQAA